jgi:hypothetical protein
MPEDIIRELDKVYGISGSGQGAELLKSVTDAVIPDVDGTLERVQEKTDVTEVDASAPEVEKSSTASSSPPWAKRPRTSTLNPLRIPRAETSRVLVRYRVDGF